MDNITVGDFVLCVFTFILTSYLIYLLLEFVVMPINIKLIISQIDRIDSNLKSDLSNLKSNLKSDLTRIETKIDKVEESVRLLEKSDYFTKGYEQARRELASNK